MEQSAGIPPAITSTVLVFKSCNSTYFFKILDLHFIYRGIFFKYPSVIAAVLVLVRVLYSLLVRLPHSS